MTVSSSSRGWFLSAAVLMLGLVATVGASLGFAHDLQRDRERRFGAAAERARDAVGARLQQHVHNVVQLRDWLMVNHNVTRAQFHDHAALGFAQGLYPGVQAVSFAPLVNRADLGAFEAAVRADSGANGSGYPPFVVHPTSDASQLYVVDYVEPLKGNEPAFGFDLGSDPVRRAAVEGSRDRGDAVGTAPVRLVQELGDQLGFVLTSAVYDTASIPETAPGRRRHFVGAVTIVFRYSGMFAGVLGPTPEVEAEVYDLGPTTDPPGSRFEATNRLLHTERSPVVSLDGQVPGLHRQLDLNIGDRRWRMVLTPAAGFGNSIGYLAAAVAILGTLASLLLASAVRSATRARGRAERRAVDMTADLRAAEDRSTSIVAGAPDATVVVDSNGRIVLVNRAAEALFGYPGDEMVGEPIEILLPDQLRDTHRVHRDRYLDEPRRREMGADLELLGRRRDGSTFPLEVSLSPLSGPGGTTEVIAAARDISGRRRAEAALQAALDHERDAAEQLRRSNEQKAAFLSTISHELRTPLTAIIGFTDLLLRESMSPDQRDDFLRRVQRNADGLGILIAETLAFAQLERHDVVLQPTALDIGAEVRLVVDQLGPVLERHRVNADATEPAIAFVDRDAFTRILTNLLTNASRYAPIGTTISVETRSEGDVAVLSVTDDGPGIPTDEQDRVFERFYRGSAALAARVPGTGVGLAVVKELAELSGGSARVDATSDRGARIVVELPSSDADALIEPVSPPTVTIADDDATGLDRR